MRYVFIVLISLLIGGCWFTCTPPDKPESIPNTAPIVAPPVTQITINVENYETWGDYAVLQNIIMTIWWRIIFFAAIISLATWYISTKTVIIPKMLLSGLLTAGVYGVSWFFSLFIGKFIWGQMLIDCLLAVIVANLFYSGILKGKLFKKD